MTTVKFETWFRVSVIVMLVWINHRLDGISESAELARVNAARAIEQASEAATAAEEARNMCDR